MPATPGLAVVTGASSGIGAALARRIAEKGRPVLAVARRGDRLRALSEAAHAAGTAAIHPLALDVTEPGAPGRLAEAARALGGAAWLVNDAGAGAYGAFGRLDVERLAGLVRLNCEAVLRLTHALLPQLMEAGAARRDGAMLVVGSAASFQPTPYLGVYGATKAFALSLAEALSEEWRGTGVFAGAFCPGPVLTEFGETAGVGARRGWIPFPLSADQAARAALAQLERRRVVVAPTLLYGFTSRVVGFLPRWAVRRVSGIANRGRA